MKNLFGKLKDLLRSLGSELVKATKKINPDIVFVTAIVGVLGSLLAWMTMLNIIYFPYLLTWLCFILPVIAVLIAVVYMFVKPNDKTVSIAGITTASSVALLSIGGIIGGGFGFITFFYTFPVIIFFSCAYLLYYEMLKLDLLAIA